ncbi:MAG: hypothetical protein IPH78_09730 [Bacteroidetes bacterium]|nr:hypothetical protein [Bacteroidota bacterium]
MRLKRWSAGVGRSTWWTKALAKEARTSEAFINEGSLQHLTGALEGLSKQAIGLNAPYLPPIFVHLGSKYRHL